MPAQIIGRMTPEELAIVLRKKDEERARAEKRAQKRVVRQTLAAHSAPLSAPIKGVELAVEKTASDLRKEKEDAFQQIIWRRDTRGRWVSRKRAFSRFHELEKAGF